MTTAIRSMVQFLNQYKQTIKDGSGALTLGFAHVALYDLACNWRERNFTQLSGSVSLVLSGAISPWGVKAISAIAHRCFTPQKLESMFGRNTIFAINPWHPRHVASIAALAFMAPTIVRQVGVLTGRVKPEKTDQLARTLTWGVLLSFLFNRVVLHTVNQLASKMTK